MTATVIILGITVCFLIFFLVKKNKENNKLQKEKEAWIQINNSFGSPKMSVLIEAEDPNYPDFFAGQVGFKFKDMIEQGVSVAVLMDCSDAWGITAVISTSWDANNKVDVFRSNVQKTLMHHLDQETLKNWVNKGRPTEKDLERLNSSTFFTTIQPSYLVWSPVY